MKFLYFVSNFAILADQLEGKVFPVESPQSIHLSRTVVDIIRKYFKTHSNNIAFYQAGQCKPALQIQSSILNEVLWRIGTRQSVVIASPTGRGRIFGINDVRRLNVVFLDRATSYKYII